MELKYGRSWTSKELHAWGPPILGFLAFGATLASIQYAMNAEGFNLIFTICLAIACLCGIAGILAHKNGKKSAMTGYIFGGCLALVIAFGSYLIGIASQAIPTDAPADESMWVLGIVIGIVALIGVVAAWVLIRTARQKREKDKRRHAPASSHSGPFLN